MSTQILVRSALLLAMAIMIQSIRLIIPLPTMVSIFIIGTGVNCILALLVWSSSVSFAVGACFLLPLIAFLQGQGGGIVFFIPLIGIGNTLYILLAKKFADSKFLFILPAAVKTSFIFVCLMMTFKVLGLEGKIVEIYSFLMGWPQLVTGSLGILLARTIKFRLKVLDNK